MNQPQQPYGQPQWIPPAQQPKKLSTGKKIAIGIAAAFGGLFMLGACAALLGNSEDGTGSTAARTAAETTTAPAEPTENTHDKPKEQKEPKEKPAPAAKPKTAYSDGDYIVGEDIPPGTYESKGAKKGMFELCSITSEPTDDRMPILKAANADERLIVTFSKGDGTITIGGCEPLTRR